MGPKLWIDIAAVALLAAGVSLGISARKQQFDRLNSFGIAQYSSYWASTVAKLKDLSMKAVAGALLISGGLALGLNHAESWGWAVVLPLAGSLAWLFASTKR